jgi:hypothetical protein
MNVWCARCGDPGHYVSECQRPIPKRIHYVNPEEEVFYAQPEEEEEEASAIYQVQPTYGRGKAPQLPIRVVYGAGRPPRPPARLERPIDLRARPIRVKWPLTDCPW